MVDVSELIASIHPEMRSLHEAWAGGMRLQPSSMYGIRANRNGSSLYMHYDKVSEW